MYCETGVLGARGSVQCWKAGLDQWSWWLSQRGRDLYWLHDAGIPGQVHAIYESTPGIDSFHDGRHDLWKDDSGAAQFYSGITKQRTRMAACDNSAKRDFSTVRQQKKKPR